LQRGNAAASIYTESCKTVSYCAPGFACDFSNRCVRRPDVESDTTGLGSAQPPSGAGAAVGRPAALLLSLAAARRRWARRADR
jgi:hypothetical protein